MAFVDDPNKNSQETPVSGPAPLSNEAPMVNTSDQSVTPGSNAPTSSTGASINQVTSKGSSTNKKAPRASSGAYTNIQKYVEKNKPQAQKMAGAVSKDVGKQAESIRNAVESQKAQKENILQANTQAIQGATDWAKNLVGNITGQQLERQTEPTPGFVQPKLEQQPYNPTEGGRTQNYNQPITPYDLTKLPEKSDLLSKQESVITGEVTGGQPTIEQPSVPYQPSEEDIARFQSLMQGNVQGVQAPQDLNIRKDQAKANALQQLAGTANTEAGRRNLLQQTFQKQGDYTRGMSGLDQLITSGDQAAREQMVTGTQGQAQTLQDQLQSALTGYQGQQRAQQAQLAGLGEKVKGWGTEAVGDIESQLQTNLDNEITARMNAGEDYQTALDNAKNTYDQYLKDLGSVENIQDVAKILKGADTSLWGRGESVFGDLASGDYQIYDPTLDIGSKYETGGYRKLTPEEIASGNFRLARVNEDQLRKVFDEISGRYNPEGYDKIDSDEIWKKAWKGSKSSSKAKEDQRFKASSIVNAFKNLSSQLQQRGQGGNITKMLQSQLGGQNLEDYFKAEGLDKFDLASEEDLNKYNNLKKILGQSEVVDEQLDDAVKTESLNELLRKYL